MIHVGDTVTAAFNKGPRIVKVVDIRKPTNETWNIDKTMVVTKYGDISIDKCEKV